MGIYIENYLTWKNLAIITVKIGYSAKAAKLTTKTDLV